MAVTTSSGSDTPVRRECRSPTCWKWGDRGLRWGTAPATDPQDAPRTVRSHSVALSCDPSFVTQPCPFLCSHLAFSPCVFDEVSPQWLWGKPLDLFVHQWKDNMMCSSASLFLSLFLSSMWARYISFWSVVLPNTSALGCILPPTDTRNMLIKSNQRMLFPLVVGGLPIWQSATHALNCIYLPPACVQLHYVAHLWTGCGL